MTLQMYVKWMNCEKCEKKNSTKNLVRHQLASNVNSERGKWKMRGKLLGNLEFLGILTSKIE